MCELDEHAYVHLHNAAGLAQFQLFCARLGTITISQNTPTDTRFNEIYLNVTFDHDVFRKHYLSLQSLLICGSLCLHECVS